MLNKSIGLVTHFGITPTADDILIVRTANEPDEAQEPALEATAKTLEEAEQYLFGEPLFSDGLGTKVVEYPD